MRYRVSGVGIGVGPFGLSLNWEKSEGDDQVARSVLVFLEDRRLLFGQRHSDEQGPFPRFGS